MLNLVNIFLIITGKYLCHISDIAVDFILQIVSIYAHINRNIVILTNDFQKKTQKTPANEIEICKERMKDFIKRGAENEK